MADLGPVVVGTDFSESAAAALAEGRRLAERLGARLEVVHVLDGASAGWLEENAAGGWLSAAALDAGELVFRYGSAAVELARYAAVTMPALLVVGTHGRSGFQPLTIGSTATRLAVHARCPVVLVSPRSGGEQLAGTVVREGAAAGVRNEPGRP